jgi:hypothetical protein
MELEPIYQPKCAMRRECKHGFLWPNCLAPACENAKGGIGLWATPVRSAPKVETPAPPLLNGDIVGLVVGRITVGALSGTKDKLGKPEHDCVCECGAKCRKSRTAIRVAKQRNAMMACTRACSANGLKIR